MKNRANPIAPANCTKRYYAARAAVALAEQPSSSPEELAAANEELAAAKLALFRSDEPHPPYSCHGSIPCWREVGGQVVCAFDQSKPDDGTLVGPPEVFGPDRGKRSWHLVYRRPDGSEVVVPNHGNNQPIEWRVDTLRWKAERARGRAEFYAAQPPTLTSTHMVVDMLAQADRLEAQARELEAT